MLMLSYVSPTVSFVKERVNVVIRLRGTFRARASAERINRVIQFPTFELDTSVSRRLVSMHSDQSVSS